MAYCVIVVFLNRESVAAVGTEVPAGGGGGGDSTDSDFLLAQMLQLEFDEEHDRQVTAEERHYNKQSRGKQTKHSYCV